MTHVNQNNRAKVRLELESGVLIEVPLYIIARAIEERHMLGKDVVHWGFSQPLGMGESEPELLHLIVSRRAMRTKDGIEVGNKLLGNDAKG